MIEEKKKWKAFREQRANSKGRGISFELSFAEWCAVWDESGFWRQRGRRRGQYVMARFNDRGAYRMGNIKIITVGQNGAEVMRGGGYSNRDWWTPERKLAQAKRMRKMVLARWARAGEKERSAELSSKRWADEAYKIKVGAAISISLLSRRQS